MMVYRMTFDVAVSRSNEGDFYDLQNRIVRAIKGVAGVAGAEAHHKNSLLANGVDVDLVLKKQAQSVAATVAARDAANKGGNA